MCVPARAVARPASRPYPATYPGSTYLVISVFLIPASGREERSMTAISSASGQSAAGKLSTVVPPVPRPDINRKRLARMGWGFSAPALVVIAAVTIFPIVYSVVMSLNNVNVTGSGFSLDGFTFSNYNLLIHASLWRDALFFTLYYTAVTVVVE